MIITLKDGSTREYGEPMSIYDIAKDISEGLAMKKSIQKMEVDVLAAMTGI